MSKSVYHGSNVLCLDVSSNPLVTAAMALSKSGGKLLSMYGTTEAGPLTVLDGKKLTMSPNRLRYVRCRFLVLHSNMSVYQYFLFIFGRLLLRIAQQLAQNKNKSARFLG